MKSVKTPKDSVTESFVAKTKLANSLAAMRTAIGDAIAPGTVKDVDVVTKAILDITHIVDAITKGLEEK